MALYCRLGDGGGRGNVPYHAKGRGNCPGKTVPWEYTRGTCPDPGVAVVPCVGYILDDGYLRMETPWQL